MRQPSPEDASAAGSRPSETASGGLDGYVNKRVDFKFRGAELQFDLSHALFSSFDIDQGTRLLLKAVGRDPVLAQAKRILDEGCGVGVIGLAAAKAFPEAEVVLRDRDSLAVAFAERNRILNKLKGVSCWKDPSTGEERAARPAPKIEWGLLADGREGGPYDFVLSNLPAKAGGPVLASFFARLSGGLLAPGGRAAIVIVKPLSASAETWIAEAGLSVVARESGTGHDVYVVEVSAAAGVRSVPEAARSGGCPQPPSAYYRGEERFKLAELSYRAQGFWGLPEFDTPGFGSSVSAEILARLYAPGSGGNKTLAPCARVLLLEPGVGHCGIWIARRIAPARIVAASRDALSLAAVAANLSSLPEQGRPEYLALDALGLPELEPASFDLILESPAIVPERDWTAEAWERAGRLLKPKGAYLAVASPTESARLERKRPSEAGQRWTLVSRKRKKGFIAAAWRLG